MRAVIYARYSSDKQNDRSIEDQVALCETTIARDGLIRCETYTDRAISGASTIGRFGLAKLMQDARAGAFDVVVVEHLDRIARDQEDLAGIFKRLRHCGIEIRTVHSGRADEVHVGVAGLMGSLYLRDLAAKTHRGLVGQVRQGLSGGGLSYGYRLVPGSVGQLEIDPEKRPVVLRIFREYAEGSEARSIAGRLNADGIAGPRGGVWNASTLLGSRQRANGILRNQLYAGVLVWNRQRFVKDPDTGKRISRLNPQESWITVARQDLRIVDDELWQAAQAHREGRSFAAPRRGAPRKHLLSGLLKCLACGSSFTMAGTDKRGTVMACSRHRESGACDNKKKIALADAERRILDGIGHHLADPDLVAEYVREWHRATAELEAQDRQRKAEGERRLAELDRKIAAIVTAIEDGLATRAMGERLRELEAERASLIEDHGEAPAQPENVISMHPGIIESYRRRIADLRAALQTIQDETARQRVQEQFRALIEKIIVVPGEAYKPVDYVIHGKLAGLLEVSEKARKKSVCNLVAGAGFEPTTFRL